MASQEGVSLLSLLWVAPQEDHIAVYLVVLSGWYQGCALGNRGPQTILCQKPLTSHSEPPFVLCSCLFPISPPVDAMEHCNSLFSHLCCLLMRWDIIIVYFFISITCRCDGAL